MPGGGLLIDTPGMRELQLWTTAEGGDAAGAAFDDIDALAAGCHFTDCRHRSEPRCAVRTAVEEGRLDASRLESFHKLEDEARSLAARQDARDRIVERAQAKTDRQVAAADVPHPRPELTAPGRARAAAALAPRQLASSCRTRSPVSSAASVSKCRSAKVVGWPIRRNSASKAASERTSG